MVYIEIAPLPAVITPLPKKHNYHNRSRNNEALTRCRLGRTLTPITADLSGARNRGRRLDGFLLLAAGGEDDDPMAVDSADLSSLRISEILEEDLGYFVNMEKLDLSDNIIKDDNIMEYLSSLRRLRQLSLACNHLSDIKLEEMLIKLEMLNLSFNELQGEVMPILAAGCPRLKHLDLSNNCVSSVPPCAGFTSLTELNLANNDLVQYDQWRALEQLSVLAKLNLSGNRIKRLKNEVAVELTAEDKKTSFRGLVYIDLSDNEIACAGNLDVLFDFPALRTVQVKGNPLQAKTTLVGSFEIRGVRFVLEALGESHRGHVPMDTRTFVTVPEQKVLPHSSPWDKYTQIHRGDPGDEGLLPLTEIDQRLEASRCRCREELEKLDSMTYCSALRTPPFAVDKTTQNQTHLIERLTTPEFFVKMKARSTVRPLKVEQEALPVQDGVCGFLLDCVEDDTPESVKTALASLRLD